MSYKPVRTDADFSSFKMREEGTVFKGMLWMLGILIFFFWVPVVGVFAAGVIGGKKSGSIGNALLAAFLPCLILMGLLFVFASFLSGIPFIGAVAAMGGMFFYGFNLAPLFLGAILGGAFA